MGGIFMGDLISQVQLQIGMETPITMLSGVISRQHEIYPTMDILRLGDRIECRVKLEPMTSTFFEIPALMSDTLFSGSQWELTHQNIGVSLQSGAVIQWFFYKIGS